MSAGNTLPWPGAGPPDATTTHKGLLSKDDKIKLDGLARPLIRLAFNQAADLFAGTALVANTWTNVGAAQSFALTAATTVYALSVRLNAPINFAGSAFFVGTRVLIDTTPVVLSGAVGGPAWAPAVGGTFYGSSLAGGVHTVQVQVICNVAGALYLRPATAPNFELLAIQVVELMP